MLNKNEIRIIISEIDFIQDVCQHLKDNINERISAIKKRGSSYSELEGLAINMMHFYSAIESIFERIAKYVDCSLPTGQDWHQELLERMSREIIETRGPVISRETLERLREFKSFRHKSYKSFDITYSWDKMKDLANSTNQTLDLFIRDINNFRQFLMDMLTYLPEMPQY